MTEPVDPLRFMTKKQRVAEAYRQGYAQGFNIGRTRRDWGSLVLGLGLGFSVGLAATTWLRVVLWS